MAGKFKTEPGTRAQVSGGDYDGQFGEVLGDYEGQVRVSLDGTQEVVLLDAGALGAIKEPGAPVAEEPEAPADPKEGGRG